MIKHPIALILGAGASKPYGFPIGSELTELLTIELIRAYDPQVFSTMHDLYQGSPIQFPSHSLSPWSILHELDFTEKDCSDFALEFATSGLATIDLFLGKNHQRQLPSKHTFGDFGGKAVATCLCPFEGQERLLLRGRDQWYHEFANQLELYECSSIESAISYLEQSLVVVNFNYDRSFEFFLIKHLMGTLNISHNAAWQILQKIIYHPYGQLGTLDDTNPEYVPYEPLSGTVRDNLQQIKTRIERSSKDLQFTRQNKHELATDLLQRIAAASRCYFLGFGFHKENVALLGEKLLTRIKMNEMKAYSTEIGDGPTKVRNLEMKIPLTYHGRCHEIFLKWPLN